MAPSICEWLRQRNRNDGVEQDKSRTEWDRAVWALGGGAAREGDKRETRDGCRARRKKVNAGEGDQREDKEGIPVSASNDTTIVLYCTQQ